MRGERLNLLGRAVRGCGGVWRDERGSITVEFVLVLPVLATVVLVLTQVSMMYRGRLVVEYAAYCAARKAIVVLPTSDEDESWNVVLGGGSSKMREVHRVASWSLMSVAEPGGAGESNGGSLSSAFTKFLRDSGDVSGAGWVRRADGALREAERRTVVLVSRPVLSGNDAVGYEAVSRWPGGGGGGFTFGPRDSVMVRVEHDLYLGVPFAGPALGKLLGGGTLPGGAGYVPVAGQSTMTLEGVIDALPEPPWPDGNGGAGVRRLN